MHSRKHLYRQGWLDLRGHERQAPNIGCKHLVAARTELPAAHPSWIDEAARCG
ncbi:MAG: hypothetical protein Q4G66_03735 [bacterium]|nr:hypothetical protein [bacterium]